MIATPANTSPLERYYAKLQLVGHKRRNRFASENLKVLHLLAAINHLCPLRGASEYDHKIKRLVQIHTIVFVG